MNMADRSIVNRQSSIVNRQSAVRIGIVGAESSHTRTLSQLINIDGVARGVSVDAIWGETRAFAEETATAGRIPTIVRKPEQMIGMIDAVIIAHRHGKYHLPAAAPFIGARIPTFVDKPFCYRADEGREFLHLARRLKTPVTSFSVIPEQASARRFRREMDDIGDLLAGATYGPCDLRNKWGGVFFYGFHQVDLALKTFGYRVRSVRATKVGRGGAAQLIYRNGAIVTLNFIAKGQRHFALSALGTKKAIHRNLTFDKSRFLPAVKKAVAMFKTGEEPHTREEILKPIQVLEAIEKALVSGEEEKVAR